MPQYDVDEESAFWPWVIGIVVLAMVVWVAAELTSGENVRGGDTPDVVAESREPAQLAVGPDSVIPVESFRAWVRDSAQVQARAGGGYADAGLARLIAALNGVARATGDQDLVDRVSALRSSRAPMHSVMEEALSIVAAMNGADVERNLAGARAALDDLDPAGPPEQQRHRIYSYFDFMSQALTPEDDAPSGQADRAGGP